MPKYMDSTSLLYLMNKIDARISQRYTADDVLAKLKTVDGSGSGLDADLLDGRNASIATAANTVAVRNENGWLQAQVFHDNGSWDVGNIKPYWIHCSNTEQTDRVHRRIRFDTLAERILKFSNYKNSHGHDSVPYANNAGAAATADFSNGPGNISNQNCLNDKNTGFYMGINCPEAPSPSNWNYFLWFRHNDKWAVIFSIPLNYSGHPVWRQKRDGVWTPWGELAANI